MAFTFMDPRRNHLEKSKKSEEAQRVLDALDEYLEGNIAEPVQWLVHFWGDQAAAFTYKELRSIVTETTDPEKIFNIWYQDYSRLIRDRMTSLWRESFLAAAHSDPRLTSVGFDFDFSDRKVKNWILNRTGELITSVTNTQIEAVKYIIAESKTAHMGAEETARYIRPVVGLTQPQAAANLKYYNNVKEKLREDHPRMKDASIERKAREAAAKYAGKQQRERAHTIAETEMAMAYNRGMDDSIRQAVNKGILPVMRKVWSTSGNGLVCSACQDLEGTEIDMDKEFSITIGKKVKRELKAEVPPLHPRCHCAVVYEETEQWVEAESEYQEISYEGLEDTWKDLGEYDQLIDVNPDERNDNCVNCSIAYEMRCRGKDVVSALPIKELIENPFSGWVNPDPIAIPANSETQEYIRAVMGIYGEGARMQISYEMLSANKERIIGHSIIAHQYDNVTNFIDPQLGKGYNIDDMNEIFNSAFNIRGYRIDQAEINEIGFIACRER